MTLLIRLVAMLLAPVSANVCLHLLLGRGGPARRFFREYLCRHHNVGGCWFQEPVGADWAFFRQVRASHPVASVHVPSSRVSAQTTSSPSHTGGTPSMLRTWLVVGLIAGVALAAVLILWPPATSTA